MPADASLVKYMNQINGGSRGRLHWGRADLDGAPFRGNAPPIGPEEELESRLTRVHDARNRIFDTSDPKENADYMQVVDRIVNGWYQLVHRKHRHVLVKYKDKDGMKVVKMKVLVYVEWLEPYMEDGKPHLSQRPYVGKSNAEA